MVSKMRGILFIFFILPLVSSQSFTVVLDTTGSMEYYIDVIQSNLRSVVDLVRLEPHIEEFVLVPFKDPDVGVPTTSKSSEEFLGVVNAIRPSGGTDCPENSLAGIRKGLEISKPDSFIYVFTDAFANDYNQVSAVKDLCKSTKSKVVIFLSGRCSAKDGTIDIYKNITEFCSGVIFQLNPSNFREAFQLMKKMTVVEWNSVQSYGPITNGYEFQISANAVTSNIMIVATGAQTSISVKDCTDCINVMHDSRSYQVISFKPQEGTYDVNLNCETCLSLAVYKRLNLKFKYGFSPRRVQNIKETSGKPIPGIKNFITIFLSTDGVSLESMELQSDGSPTTEMKLEQLNPRCYYAPTYIHAEKRYRLIVHGYDSSISERLSGSTNILKPQTTGFAPASIKPVIEIIEPDNTLVEYEMSLTIACKVTAYPKPNIWWEDGDAQKLNAEVLLLENPSIYLSYVTVVVSSNTTLICKSNNWDGEASEKLNLYVNKTAILEFEVEPKDETIEYGKEGKIFCKVNSYPKATVKWYHNNTLLENSEDVKIKPEDNAVVIQKMGLDDVGEYKCEVSNKIDVKSSTANINVSGLEYPEVDTGNAVLSIQVGERSNISCRITKGKPAPALSWQYKSNDNDKFGDLPKESNFTRSKRGLFDFFSSENSDKQPSENSNKKIDTSNNKLLPANKLTINVFKAGIYKCTGTNILGEDSKQIVLQIQTPPKIKNSKDETVSVKKGKWIQLPCEIEGSASVRWEIFHGDVHVPITGRHYIDKSSTLRFTALSMDSGEYHCIAENEYGKADKRYTVIVLVRPYIEPPKSKSVTASLGSTVTLTCNMLQGSPEPSTRWEFISPGSPPTILLKGNSRIDLMLKDVTKAQEGNYRCIADNIVGIDSIKIAVNVY